MTFRRGLLDVLDALLRVFCCFAPLAIQVPRKLKKKEKKTVTWDSHPDTIIYYDAAACAGGEEAAADDEAQAGAGVTAPRELSEQERAEKKERKKERNEAVNRRVQAENAKLVDADLRALQLRDLETTNEWLTKKNDELSEDVVGAEMVADRATARALRLEEENKELTKKSEELRAELDRAVAVAENEKKRADRAEQALLARLEHTLAEETEQLPPPDAVVDGDSAVADGDSASSSGGETTDGESDDADADVCLVREDGCIVRKHVDRDCGGDEVCASCARGFAESFRLKCGALVCASCATDKFCEKTFACELCYVQYYAESADKFRQGLEKVSASTTTLDDAQ